MRKDIAFQTEDRVTLRGWLYQPDDGDGPFPTIVMAHGFSATKEMHLDDFAAVFARGGFAVLVYDNRNLGASDGTPRGEIVPYQQIQDYRDAISFASTLPELDPARIGVWGSSYSGAHVLVVAALDRRVKCVVSQVPLVSGLENGRRLVRADHMAGLRAAFDADRAARYRGEAPQMIPVVSAEPGGPCVLPTADSAAFFLGATERAPSWQNAVTLRSVELFLEYEPHVYLPQISPTPLLLVVAAGDHLTVQDLALRAYATALEPKRLLLLDGGHFDAYSGEGFTRNSAEQLAWFSTHLRPH
jgi:hypothetical protein